MGVYRQINVNYWQDGFVLELDPLEKFFFIYLLCCSKSNQCGILEPAIKIIVIETGLSQEQVVKYNQYNNKLPSRNDNF